MGRTAAQPASSSSASSIRARSDTERWVAQLRIGHPKRDQTLVKLHALLLRVAFHELSRRRSQLAIGGPEFDDLAQQAADDALVKILAKLDEFRGLSRFTTWAYKFVVFEVSNKVARHAWRRQPPSRRTLVLEAIPDPRTSRLSDQLEDREQLASLCLAMKALPSRQREVFIAVALNNVQIDVLAVQLRTNRNAIYKNLFDARRTLRARMAAAGHPLVGDLVA